MYQGSQLPQLRSFYQPILLRIQKIRMMENRFFYFPIFQLIEIGGDVKVGGMVINHKEVRDLQYDWPFRGVKEILLSFFILFSSLAYPNGVPASLKIRKGRQQ